MRIAPLDEILADLRAHPDSSAREIAARLGVDHPDVFRQLDDARASRRLDDESVRRWAPP